MTDAERLLEIATGFMKAFMFEQAGMTAVQRTACWALAEQVMIEWRERTGAQGREVEQDVVGNALDAAYRAAVDNGEAEPIGRALWGLIVDHQRARAAGKGEG